MLDSIYHMTLNIFCNQIFGCEKVKIIPNICDIIMSII